MIDERMKNMKGMRKLALICAGSLAMTGMQAYLPQMLQYREQYGV